MDTIKLKIASLAVGLLLILLFADNQTVLAAPQQLDPDPGIADTVAMELDVDTIAGEATLRMYVFNDEMLIGASSGFVWNNVNFQLDTAIIEDFVSAGFDIGPFTFQDATLATSNSNQQFLFAGVTGISGDSISANPAGRRLWVTYLFTFTDWAGYDSDNITIDTSKFNVGSDLLFVAEGQLVFRPIWTGEVIFGSPLDVRSVPTTTLPQSFGLSQNYPNPFNPMTEIVFDIPHRTHVQISVFNILGQQVTTLVDGEFSAGSYITDWQGTSDNGNPVSSGIYFYKLQTDSFSETRKMILLK